MMIKKPPVFAMVLICAIMAVYCLLAFHYINHGELNADEGFYALAAKKVMAGELPYRDFGYSQTPLLPYVNGFFMKIVGFGFIEQRFVNAFWGFATLALLISYFFVYQQSWPFLWAALLVAMSPHWVRYVCLGKSYAAAGFFLTLTTCGLMIAWRFPVQLMITIAGGVLAIGCRLTTAPVIFLLWAVFLWQRKSGKERVISAIAMFAGCLLFFLPFYLVSPENFIFWNLGYHLEAVTDRRGWLSFYEHLLLAPGVMLFVIAGLFYLAWHRENLRSQNSGILFAIVAGVMIHLGLQSSYGENSTPFMAAGAMSAALLLYPSKWFRYTLVIALFTPILYFYASLPQTNEKITQDIRQTAAFVAARVPENGKILTPFPIIAVEADRDVFPGMEMGKFAITAEIEQERARRLGLMPHEDMIQLISAGKPDALVLHSFPSNWNFAWSAPSLMPLDEGRLQNFKQTVLANYQVAFKNETFAVLLRK